MKITIDYGKISNSLEHYQKAGFKYIDADWVIPKDIIDITKPSEMAYSILNNNQYLVGSGEQSFIHQIKQERLRAGKYICATPCFRDDPADEIHREYFLKTELINI